MPTIERAIRAARGWLAQRGTGAPVAKAEGDFDESSHPRADDGKFGSGGGGGDKAPKEAPAPAEHGAGGRADGKPMWREPPAVGAADHPSVRDEKPALDPKTFVEGTRTDPAMWSESGGRHYYDGEDGGPTDPVAHEWPAPKGAPSDAPAVFGKQQVGSMYKEALNQSITHVVTEHPAIHWMLEQHPLNSIRMTPIVDATVHIGGVYDKENSKIHLNTNAFDHPKEAVPFVMGDSWIVSCDAKDSNAQTSGFLVHELGHHLSTAPGVEKIMQDAWRTREEADRSGAVSGYAKTNADEYFAESFAAYHRDSAALGAHDYDAFMMIERSLATLERKK